MEFLKNFNDIMTNYKLHSNFKNKEYKNRISRHLIIEELETNEIYYLKYIKTNCINEFNELKTYYSKILKYINKPFKNELCKIHDIHVFNDEDNFFEFVIILEYGESDCIDIEQITFIQIIKYIKSVISILKDLHEYELCLNNIYLKNLVVIEDSIKLSGFKPYIILDKKDNWKEKLFKKLGENRYNLFLLGILWVQFLNFDIKNLFKDKSYDNLKRINNELINNEELNKFNLLIKFLDYKNNKDIDLKNLLFEFEELILQYQESNNEIENKNLELIEEENKSQKSDYIFSIKNDISYQDNETCYFAELNNYNLKNYNESEKMVNISFADKNNIFLSNYNSNISNGPKKLNPVLKDIENKNYKEALNKLKNFNNEDIEIIQIKIDCFYNLKDFKNAYNLLIKSVDNKFLNKENLIEIYKKLSFCCNHLDKNLESINFLEKSINLFIDNNMDINSEFFDLLEILILMKVKNKQNDIEVFLNFFKKHKNNQKYYNILFNISLIFIEIKEFNLALKYLERSKEFFKNNGNIEDYLKIIFYIAVCYLNLEQYKKSEIKFEKFLKICNNNNFFKFDEYYLSFFHLGIIEYYKEKFNKSINLLNKFLDFNQNKDKEKFNAIKLLGFCFFNLENFNKSIEFLESINIEYNIENLNCILILFKSYLKLENYDKIKIIIKNLKNIKLNNLDNDLIFKIYYYKFLYYDKINNLKEAELNLNKLIENNIKIYGNYSDEHLTIVRLLLKILEKKKDNAKKIIVLDGILKFYNDKENISKNILEHLSFFYFMYYEINKKSSSKIKWNIINKIKKFNEKNKILTNKELEYILNQENWMKKEKINYSSRKSIINKSRVSISNNTIKNNINNTMKDKINKINDFENQIEEFFQRVIYLLKFGYLEQYKSNFNKFQEIFNNKNFEINYKEEKIIFMNINNLLILFIKNNHTHKDVEDDLFTILQKISEIEIKNQSIFFKNILIILFLFNNTNFLLEYYFFLKEENLINSDELFVNNILTKILFDFEEEFFSNYLINLEKSNYFIMSKEIISNNLEKNKFKDNIKFINININFLNIYFKFIEMKEIKSIIEKYKSIDYISKESINKELILIYYKLTNNGCDNTIFENISKFNNLIDELTDKEFVINKLLYFVHILFIINEYYFFEKIDDIFNCKENLLELNLEEKEKINLSIFFSKYGDIYYKFQKYDYCKEYKLNSLNLIKEIKNWNFNFIEILKYNSLKDHLFNIFSFLCISFLKLNETSNTIDSFEKIKKLKLDNKNTKIIKLMLEIYIYFENQKYLDCEKNLLRLLKILKTNEIKENLYELLSYELLNKIYYKTNNIKEFNKFKNNYIKLKKKLIK